jgi:anti-sigma-K factor RskA
MKIHGEVLEQLAAEYVLGTLRGQARVRFEQYMRDSARVRQEVWFWEAQLGLLLNAVPSAPSLPARQWQRIEQRLWGSLAPAARGGWWRWWAVAATAMTLLLALTLWWTPSPERLPVPTLATILQEQGVQRWSVSLSGDHRQLRVTSLDVMPAGDEADYELWIVPVDGAPLSLGIILPAQSVQNLQLTAAQSAALASQLLLAVSLEPGGGSPTGVPTGPVLYTGVLVPI